MVQSRNRLLTMIIALLCYFGVCGQYFEGGIMIGGSAYEGDLSPTKIMDKIATIRPSGGLFVRQNFNEHWAARLTFQFGTLTAADLEERAYRNLSFTSPITEFSATAEFSWPGYDPAAFKRLSPYIYAGIGLFRFNPKADYQGEKIELRNLGTEGQGLEGYDLDFYNLDQISIIAGGGIKYAISPSLTVAVEFAPRYTFTDYLDDVSGNYARYRDLAGNRGTLAANLADRAHELTGGEPDLREDRPLRGSPAYKDWYFMGHLTISYHFYDLFTGNGTGCPTW